MAGIVQNIVQNSLAGFVGGAVSTAGGYAGSTVNGLGTLIENAGESVGMGIAKGFEGVGNSIAAYGAGVQNATAPNAGFRKIEARSKPASASKPSTSTTTQKAFPGKASTLKALPPSAPLKALPASPSAKKPAAPTASVTTPNKELSKVKSTYQSPSSTFKPVASQVGSFKPPASTATAAKQKDHPVKSRALSSGKVVASSRSLPKPTAPIAATAPSFNLTPPAASLKPHTPNSGFKGPGRAGSVAGGQGKTFPGHIPRLDASENPASKALPVVSGSKKAAEPTPPSSVGGGGRAVSVIQGGGPKFF